MTCCTPAEGKREVPGLRSGRGEAEAPRVPARAPDPDGGAVVDARGLVHGIERLHVADASIMPAIPSANTNLPTIMIAERIASWITAERNQP